MHTNEPSLTDLIQRLAVWAKGGFIPGEDSRIWRRDSFGNRICWDRYGDRGSIHGWEIDHIHPKALGGTDEIDNLRPLHCKPNASLGGGLGALIKDWPPSDEGGGGLPGLLSGGLFPRK